MKKNRTPAKELQFYCGLIEQTNPVEMLKRARLYLCSTGRQKDLLDFFDREFRGRDMASHRDQYPAMPCEVGVKFYLTPISNKEKEEITNPYFCLSLFRKDFLEKNLSLRRNIFINLHSALKVVETYKKEIRKTKCSGVVFFF